MRKIRITRGGCGISYEDAHGAKRHALKTPENGPFECDDVQADRLVRLGVAAYITTKAPEAQQEPDTGEEPEDPNDQEPQEPEKITGHLDAAELESWDYNKLKKLAADMGVEPKGKKKADYIAAIVAVEVEPGDEDDALPELGAADPE